VRVLFAGSPAIALPALEKAAACSELVGVLTNPPSVSGRGLAQSETAVAVAGHRLGLPVLSFEHLGSEARGAVAALKPDLLISFAYGRIFGPKFLALFPMGGINIHPSLLPKYRGATPLNAAILAGDSRTGVSIQRIALEMDAGDIYMQKEIMLDPRETAESLESKAAALGTELLAALLPELKAGRALTHPQSGEASFCPLIKKDDGLLDFGTLGAEELDRHVRAYYPWPVGFTWLRGQRLSILESFPYPGERWPGMEDALPGTLLALDKRRGLMVQTRDGLLALRRLQIQSKKALPYKDFANGLRDAFGAVLGSPAGQESGKNP